MIRNIIEKILSLLIPGRLYENKYFLLGPSVERYKYFLNYILATIMTPYYWLLMKIFRPQTITRKKYYVSVCAIFRDEGCYLKEWIEFHKIIGVEHFYLYNNFSSDNYLEVLEPYIQSGEVTLTDWPVPQGQMSAYQDCFNRFKDETNWLAFIDLDEFIIPNFTDTINEFLKSFEKRPAVLIYWLYFGSSGLIDRDINGLIIEDFKVCSKKYSTMGKMIFNTSYELDVNYRRNNHMHVMWGGYKNVMLPPVNCFDKIILRGIHKDKVSSSNILIQINHYVTKSYGEYITKKSKRGGGVHPYGFHNMDYFVMHDKECQVIDLHAYKYIIPLKLRMKEYNNLKKS